MKTTSKDGTEIAYRKSGSGPALILIDGAFCSKDFGPMPKLVPLLAIHFTVISYDRRARGESGDTLPYTIGRELEDLDALIQEVGGIAFVLGISSGAILALKAAAAGLAITRLALYEPPFNVDGKYRKAPAGHKDTLTAMITGGRKADAAKYYLTKVIGLPAIVAFIIRLTPGWRTMKANANSLPYDAEIVNDGAIPADELAGMAIPAIAIAGEKSPAMLRDASQTVAKKLANGRYVTLKGQTHNVSAAALVPVLREFLGTVDSR